MTTTRSTPTIERAESDDQVGIGTTARNVAETAATTASDLAARVPEAAEAAREAVGEADRLLRSRSDDSLVLGGMLAAGFTGGLLIGGAHRLLVIVSLLPAIAIAAVLADRRGRSMS
jgi:hypothetical protein